MHDPNGMEESNSPIKICMAQPYQDKPYREASLININSDYFERKWESTINNFRINNIDHYHTHLISVQHSGQHSLNCRYVLENKSDSLCTSQKPVKW